MADIDKLKEVADLLAENAKILLKKDRSLAPILFSFPSLDRIPIPISVKLETDEDKDMLSALMATVAQASQGMIFLTDAYARTALSSEDLENMEGQVRDHPDAVEAIILVAYAKDISSLKQIIYVSENGEYTFTDMGWSDTSDMKGRFGSPYEK
jgi:hypothetical protein